MSGNLNRVAPKEPPRTLYCSFCGKSQHEVALLIAGPQVFICNECMSLCADMVNQHVPKGENQSAEKVLVLKDFEFVPSILSGRVLMQQVFGDTDIAEVRAGAMVARLVYALQANLQGKLATATELKEQLGVLAQREDALKRDVLSFRTSLEEKETLLSELIETRVEIQARLEGLEQV